jgi:hypothetical protein
VADAPPHAGAGEGRLVDAINELRANKVGVYPVASSGIDTRAEMLMRLAARATGGRYIFLTDHSGIGSSHAAPHIDQYEVETLHQVMHRMIVDELSGGESEPPGPEGRPPAATPVDEAPEVAAVAADGILARLTQHFEFAVGFGLTMLAAVGLDVALRRRRERT